jgi:hypothetical protein
MAAAGSRRADLRGGGVGGGDGRKGGFDVNLLLFFFFRNARVCGRGDEVGGREPSHQPARLACFADCRNRR